MTYEDLITEMANYVIEWEEENQDEFPIDQFEKDLLKKIKSYKKSWNIIIIEEDGSQITRNENSLHECLKYIIDKKYFDGFKTYKKIVLSPKEEN